MAELWTRKRDGECRWEEYWGYERICEIRGSSCLIRWGTAHISVITGRLRSCTCHIRNGQFTCTRSSLNSKFPTMISSMSSDLSHSRPQLYHHIRTRSYVIPLFLSIPWLIVNTKYSIHWVLHTLHTASSQHQLSPAPSQSLISWQIMLYSIRCIRSITSSPISQFSAPVAPHFHTTASRLTAST